MSKPVVITRELASAAARDAGNRSMRAAGRAAWDADDWDAAAALFEYLCPVERERVPLASLDGTLTYPATEAPRC